jgi:phage gpG-like protein
MANTFPLNELEKHFKGVLKDVPVLLGNDAVNFFKDSFKNQGWLGNSFQPWKPRKTVTKWGKTPRNNGRAILVDSGRLRRSIRVTSIQAMRIVIGTDVPYARAHNEGVRLGLIQKVKEYKRNLTKLGITSKKQLKSRSNIEFGRVATGQTTVKEHTRRINQNIPQRQFMGYSPYLQKRLERRFQAELTKGLRKFNL